jgi:hypothetical protein
MHTNNVKNARNAVLARVEKEELKKQRVEERKKKKVEKAALAAAEAISINSGDSDTENQIPNSHNTKHTQHAVLERTKKVVVKKQPMEGGKKRKAEMGAMVATKVEINENSEDLDTENSLSELPDIDHDYS